MDDAVARKSALDFVEQSLVDDAGMLGVESLAVLAHLADVSRICERVVNVVALQGLASLHFPPSARVRLGAKTHAADHLCGAFETVSLKVDTEDGFNRNALVFNGHKRSVLGLVAQELSAAPQPLGCPPVGLLGRSGGDHVALMLRQRDHQRELQAACRRAGVHLLVQGKKANALLA
ncbi:MAG: hypothetical protein M5U25_20725 [Planctomycetota bacterium]|nr:hypothetical protein [Planctomycetota bacterium]